LVGTFPLWAGCGLFQEGSQGIEVGLQTGAELTLGLYQTLLALNLDLFPFRELLVFNVCYHLNLCKDLMTIDHRRLLLRSGSLDTSRMLTPRPSNYLLCRHTSIR
jgi:hypothetical protein